MASIWSFNHIHSFLFMTELTSSTTRTDAMIMVDILRRENTGNDGKRNGNSNNNSGGDDDDDDDDYNDDDIHGHIL